MIVDGGPIDRHLDLMFDRLSGTGSAGRRMLVEAEDHLRSAAEEARARGLDAEAAEREAVARYGPPVTGLDPAAMPRREKIVRFGLVLWATLGATSVVAGAFALLDAGLHGGGSAGAALVLAGAVALFVLWRVARRRTLPGLWPSARVMGEALGVLVAFGVVGFGGVVLLRVMAWRDELFPYVGILLVAVAARTAFRWKKRTVR